MVTFSTTENTPEIPSDFNDKMVAETKFIRFVELQSYGNPELKLQMKIGNFWDIDWKTS